MLLTKVTANVLATALVAHGHLVSAFAAPSDAVEQRRTVTGNAGGLGVEIFRPVVVQHGLDALEGLPVHIGWIPILRADPPFFGRTKLLVCPPAVSSGRTHPRPAIDKRAGIGRILKQRR